MNFTIIRPTSVLSSTDLRHLPAPRHVDVVASSGFFIVALGYVEVDPPPCMRHPYGILVASVCWHPCGIIAASLRIPCVFLRHPVGIRLACAAPPVRYSRIPSPLAQTPCIDQPPVDYARIWVRIPLPVGMAYAMITPGELTQGAFHQLK